MWGGRCADGVAAEDRAVTLVASLMARRIVPVLAAYSTRYEKGCLDLDVAQLAALNGAWQESLQASPWARALRDRLRAPAQFASWEEFTAVVPLQRKRDLRAVLTAASDVRDVEWRATGGSTAEPLRFPVLRSEPAVAALDQALGRRRLGVEPGDRLFLFWGHSHMFASGIKGAVARMRRRFADMALGYTRWSAYRLSEADLELARQALITSRARYVIGYSSALDRLARASLGHAADLHRLRLKVVVATAEGFPSPDSRDIIGRCFGCPVVMEYGSVETGPLAYERATGGYDVFWAHQRLELAPSLGRDDGRRELLVTSLYPRALPLLRYALGDWVQPAASGDDVRSRFGTVVGRCNDVVLTASGLSVHSEAFTHAVRDLPDLRCYQVVCGAGGIARRIAYEARATLPEEVVAAVRCRLAIIDASLSEIPLVRVERLAQSAAGKSPMVIREA